MRGYFAGDVWGDLNRDRRARTEGQEAKRLLREGKLRSVGDAGALHPLTRPVWG
tara:strand:+ start:49 stop:210 length:162 start_codon:yes stop_codon:yes gene_type:complete